MTLDAHECTLIIRLSGSDLVQKLRTWRELIEDSRSETHGNLTNLKKLAVLLSLVAEMQAEEIAKLEEDIYNLTTDTKEELRDFIAETKKREGFLCDILATAKDLEEAVLKVSSKLPVRSIRYDTL